MDVSLFENHLEIYEKLDGGKGTIINLIEDKDMENL
jgi:hypothetical protein